MNRENQKNNNWPTKKLRTISDEEIKPRFFVALDQLFKNDAFLLENKTHERSVAHKLAEYLQQQFSGWHVDCEYNRHGLDPKRIPGIENCEAERSSNLVLPDIIIHHRNTDDNLLVIEVKPRKSETVDECDNAKLVEFTKEDGKYRYQFGLFIGFDRLNEPQIVWYKNGTKMEIANEE